MRKIYLLFFTLIPVIAFSQFNTNFGNLIVFSEDGDKFSLILNGEKQNDVPVTNLRVEELTQPYYSAKIVFEDKTIPEITKRNLMVTDPNGNFMEVTYKIKKDKSNKAKLNYFSMIDVQHDFIPPSGVYVHHFGQPFGNPVNMNSNIGGVRNNGGFGATVNAPGMNVNISIQDPDLDVRTNQQQTTIIQQNPRGFNNNNQQPVRGCMNNIPMSATDFAAAKRTINETNFDETKLSTAKTIVASNCLSADQIVQICNSFSFEDNKLDFAKFAYRYCTEPRNYFKVSNVFSFSTSKEELNSFIQAGGN